MFGLSILGYCRNTTDSMQGRVSTVTLGNAHLIQHRQGSAPKASVSKVKPKFQKFYRLIFCSHCFQLVLFCLGNKTAWLGSIKRRCCGLNNEKFYCSTINLVLVCKNKVVRSSEWLQRGNYKLKELVDAVQIKEIHLIRSAALGKRAVTNFILLFISILYFYCL